MLSNRPEPLTRREIDVIGQLAQRKTHLQIAKDMQLSIWTVKFHVRNIYAKWGVTRRKAAVAYYQKYLH